MYVVVETGKCNESPPPPPPIVCADDVQQQVKQVKLGEAGADQPEIKSYPTSH